MLAGTIDGAHNYIKFGKDVKTIMVVDTSLHSLNQFPLVYIDGPLLYVESGGERRYSSEQKFSTLGF